MNPGTSYPPITVTVSVAQNAAATVNNQATVAGGGEVNQANDTVTDVTAVGGVTEVTAQVTVTANGKTATVTNISRSTINAPIQLVLAGLPPGAPGTWVKNATGTYEGEPYFTVSTWPLAPGGSITVTLQFTSAYLMYYGMSAIGAEVYSGSF